MTRPTSVPVLTRPAASHHVTVVGGANMDISAQTTLPLAAGDSTPGQIVCAPGGVARNVAENLARLGQVVHLISVVGDDIFGQRLLAATRAAGVNVAGVATLPQQTTATYLSVHGPDGDMAVAVNDMGILTCLTPELLQTQADVIHGGAALVLDCNLSPQALAWLMQFGAAVPVFVDAVSVVKCHKLLPWLNHIHTLKANRLEAQALSGQAISSIDEACQAALHLHQQGVRQVVLSLGAHGVCWCDASGATGHRPVEPVAVVNTSGAGDALLAGLVLAQLGQVRLAGAVALAMVCAEITLSSPFANAPELSAAAVYSRLNMAA